MMASRLNRRARELTRWAQSQLVPLSRDALAKPPILLAVLGGLAFLGGLIFAGPPLARQATLPNDNFAPVIWTPADPQAAKAILAERPLWGTAAAPVGPEMAAEPAAQAVPWRLAGVVRDQGRFVVVITEGAPPKARRLAPGAKLPDDSVIVSATPTAVTVTKNGTESILRLFKGKN